jgi:hypothetical protein
MVPTPKATTHRWANPGPPKGTASGTESSSTAEATSVAISTGRRGRRSSQAPAGRLNRRNGTWPAAASTPISRADASSVSTARSGRARAVISVPISETLSAAHSFSKSPQRPALFRIVPQLLTSYL